MIAPESEVGSDLWQTEGFATRIEYARDVIEELGIAATEGFNRLSHGGVEIGGVLFGLRTPDSIEISAHRALVCEYALGPSFTLSDNDRRTLEDLLASVATDPNLAGMQPVGCTTPIPAPTSPSLRRTCSSIPAISRSHGRSRWCFGHTTSIRYARVSSSASRTAPSMLRQRGRNLLSLPNAVNRARVCSRTTQ